GRLAFGVSLGPEPWALCLPTVGIVFAGTAFGLVVAATAPSREAVLPLGSIAIMTMAAVGGCWWPIDLEPDWMQRAALAFWTTWQQGPVASAMLGDLGADVIKIEERVGGDPGRGILKAQGLDLRDRPNFYSEANNRNKRSLTVDLKKPEGVAIVQRLAERADVFVQNFRKGVAGRLGLDAPTLRARNPRLVYASASGYGPEGPESGAPSFDYLGLARSGIMYSCGEP